MEQKCSGVFAQGGAKDEALIKLLLALEWQRGIPASFCPSSLSPCTNLCSGILPAFLYGLVCLSFSPPFTVCNIHSELISSRQWPPDLRSLLQLITVVHPAFGFQSGRLLPPYWLSRQSDVTEWKRWDFSPAAAAVITDQESSNTYLSLFSSTRSCC